MANILTMRRIVSFIKTITGASFCLVLFFACSSPPKQIVDQSGSISHSSQPKILEAVDGSSVAFGDFDGQPTVLWFWTPY